MKEYELSVLFHPDLEMNLTPALDKVKDIIKNSGGKIEKEESEGKKRLAYSIKGQDFAVYYYFNLSLPATAPNKISTAMNIADEVLRYLLVRKDERKAKYEADKANAADVEAAEEKLTEEKGE